MPRHPHSECSEYLHKHTHTRSFPQQQQAQFSASHWVWTVSHIPPAHESPRSWAAATQISTEQRFSIRGGYWGFFVCCKCLQLSGFKQADLAPFLLMVRWFGLRHLFSWCPAISIKNVNLGKLCVLCLYSSISVFQCCACTRAIVHQNFNNADQQSDD